MIRQILRNGQVTLPKEAVKFFNLKEQDLLDIHFDRAGIHLKPLSTEELSSQEYAKLAKKLDSLQNSKGKVFSTTVQARDHLKKLSR